MPLHEALVTHVLGEQPFPSLIPTEHLREIATRCAEPLAKRLVPLREERNVEDVCETRSRSKADPSQQILHRLCSNLRKTFSMSGSQFEGSNTCCHGLSISRAERSCVFQRSKQADSLNRMDGHSLCIRLPSIGSHGCTQRWGDILSTRGSHASTSAMRRGRTNSIAKCSVISAGRTAWQHSNNRRQASGSLTRQALNAA